MMLYKQSFLDSQGGAKMKMQNIEAADVKYLTKVSEVEAVEFLQEHTDIIVRVSAREFYEVDAMKDFQELKTLRERGVYGTWELYID